MMMTGGLFTSAALIGLATGCLTAAWTQIKGAINRIWSIVFVKATLTGSVGTALKAYAWANYSRSPFGERRYQSELTWVRPIKRLQQIAYEMLGTEAVIFWNGWRPILISVGTETKGSGTVTPNFGEAKITFIRGMFNLDNLLITSLERYNEFFTKTNNATDRKRFRIKRCVGKGSRRKQDDGKSESALVSGQGATFSVDAGEFRFLQWMREELGAELTEGTSALDALALTPEIFEAVEEVKHWLKSSEWYRSRQIPWTRGWLLYGPPGTGKSRFIRAVAEDCDLPVYIFDLSSMSNEEFLRYWDGMRSEAPCIAAFEDLDAVFKGRENVAGEMGGGLTFDCYLNAISGIEGAEGVLKISTTNHVENLDPALGVPQKGNQGSMSTRPGRVDRAIEMPQLDHDGRYKIAKRILSDCLNYVEETVVDGAGDTGAQFTDRCIRIALEDFWAKKEGKKCDDFRISDAGRIFESPALDEYADVPTSKCVG